LTELVPTSITAARRVPQPISAFSPRATHIAGASDSPRSRTAARTSAGSVASTAIVRTAPSLVRSSVSSAMQPPNVKCARRLRTAVSRRSALARSCTPSSSSSAAVSASESGSGALNTGIHCSSLPSVWSSRFASSRPPRSFTDASLCSDSR
jgi:hypothetical protein